MNIWCCCAGWLRAFNTFQRKKGKEKLERQIAFGEEKKENFDFGDCFSKLFLFLCEYLCFFNIYDFRLFVIFGGDTFEWHGKNIILNFFFLLLASNPKINGQQCVNWVNANANNNNDVNKTVRRRRRSRKRKKKVQIFLLKTRDAQREM